MAFFRTTVSRLFSQRYLIITNTVGSGMLMGLGDISVQLVEKRTGAEGVPRNMDMNRTGRLFVTGLGMGPLLHVWYKILDKRFPVVSAGSVARKVFLDQVIGSPLFIGYFFIGTGLLEGKSFSSCFEELKKKFLTVYLVDLVIWPAAQSINFFLLPPRFRVIYVAALAFAYNMFLSVMKHMEETAQRLIDFVNGFVFQNSQDNQQSQNK